MAKVLEALISKGRRVRRAVEQKEVAFGLADLSTHGIFHHLLYYQSSIDYFIFILIYRGIT